MFTSGMRTILLLTALLVGGIAQTLTAQDVPVIGIAGSLDNDSLLYAAGYRDIITSIGTYVSPRTASEEQFTGSLQKFKNLKLKIYAFNIFLPGDLKVTGPGINEKAILDYANIVFKRVQQAGVHRIIWGSGGSRRMPDGYDKARATAEFTSIARKLATLAGEYNITLILENLNRTETNFLNTVAEVYQIVKTIDHPDLRMNADIYHMLRENEPPAIIETASKYIVHCEIAEKENRAAPGTQHSDFQPYLTALAKLHYNQSIFLECNWTDLKAQAADAREYVSAQYATAFGTLASHAFDIIPFGVFGGSDESNLSSYAIATAGTNQFVCLDAGTLYAGIRAGLEKKSLQGTSQDVLKNQIKGYLISHPHLDHLSGLLLNAADDSPKPIYALPYTLGIMTEKYFSWKSWVNWSDKGEMPRLNKNKLVTLVPGKEIPLENTALFVTAYPLSHTTNSESTAFLIRSQDNYLLYLGDTGADETEKSTRLHELWNVAGPLIRQKKLKCILIEVSYPNAQEDKFLFGHFTPQWLMKEMNHLEAASGKGALENFTVIITHMKPAGNNIDTIKKELGTGSTALIAGNPFKFNIVFPVQGEKIEQ